MIDDSFPDMAEAKPSSEGSQSVSPNKYASNMDDVPKHVWSPSIVPGQEDAKNTSKSWWDTQGLAKRLGGGKKGK